MSEYVQAAEREATAKKTAEQKVQAENEKKTSARHAAANTMEASGQAKAKAKASAVVLHSNKEWNDAVKREQDVQAATESTVEEVNNMIEYVQAPERKASAIKTAEQKAQAEKDKSERAVQEENKMSEHASATKSTENDASSASLPAPLV